MPHERRSRERHDLRRRPPAEALGARVVAQLLATARLDRLITIAPHSDVVEASSDVPVDRLSAVSSLARALQTWVERNAVVVAPDLGAVKLPNSPTR